MTEPDRASFTHITTHEADGLALFARQFATTPNARALTRAHLTQLQEVEDGIWAVFTSDLNSATGDALDQYGRLLNFPRGMLNDDGYRAILRAFVRARRGSGTGEDLIQTATLALGAISFTYSEGGASATIEPHNYYLFDPHALLDVLTIAKPGGVALQVFYPPDVESILFAFSTDPFLAQTDVVRGFGDTTLINGGLWTGVVANAP